MNDSLRVQHLSTRNFRNLASETIDFSPHVNVLIGENGQGKTNVLEAIHFFKFGRTFRAQRDTDTICFGEDFTRIESTTRYDNGEEVQFSASLETGGGKKIRIDDTDIPKLSDLVGRYPSVLFGPQDIRVTSGFPADRRRFLDMIGSVTDRAYLELLKDYKRVLAQRSASLKRGAGGDELDTWNENLVSTGTSLIEKRTELVEKLLTSVREHAAQLTAPGRFEIRYSTGVTAKGEETVRDAFFSKLKRCEEDERRRGMTLVGPHRDDVMLRVDGNDIRRFGSQGQRRLFAIVLRLAERDCMEEATPEPCVFLLDDLFSELDAGTGERLMDMLIDTHQIFITSPVDIDWKRKEDTRVFRVSAGRLSV